MVALGLWQAPPGPVIQPPPPAPHCFVGGRAIQRVFKQHRAQLERCYARVVQFRGGAEGTVVVRAKIAADGRVLRVSTDGTLDDRRVTSCVADEVKRWTFPADAETVVVTYPLRFRLGG